MVPSGPVRTRLGSRVVGLSLISNCARGTGTRLPSASVTFTMTRSNTVSCAASGAIRLATKTATSRRIETAYLRPSSDDQSFADRVEHDLGSVMQVELL